jgi:cyclophilin family peptidyl-prolyl cis-trans isomerase
MKRLPLVAVVFGLSVWTTAFAQDAKKPRVVMETSAGKIVIELDAEKAPITVKNFLQYVDDKHYDGTTFHRVIADFMIQGGGYEPGMREKKSRAPIKNEAGNGLKNDIYTVAMARTSDPNSATAQFFINTSKKNGFLDRANAQDGVGYAVFGRVVEGMDVVDTIRRVETRKGDVPIKDVVIKSVRRVAK